MTRTTIPADEIAALEREWEDAADLYLCLVAACPAVRWRAREWSWRTLRLDVLGMKRFGELHEILDGATGTVGGDVVTQAPRIDVADPDAAIEAAAVRVMHAYRALRQAREPGIVIRGSGPVLPVGPAAAKVRDQGARPWRRPWERRPAW